MNFSTIFTFEAIFALEIDASEFVPKFYAIYFIFFSDKN
jgi:hypothetical protein